MYEFTSGERLSAGPLDDLIQRIEEEYGDPEGDGDVVTDAMVKAERVFVAAVLAEYECWACDQTGEPVEVDTVAWVNEHAARWLRESNWPGFQPLNEGATP